MPACFERWCQKFDDLLRTKAQKTGFRHYLGGLLGESERKNLTQMANNAVGVVYNRIHHFITDAPWESTQINDRRLQVMNQCSQTRIKSGFALIIDDTGHRKSGNFTSGVGRQYLGEIGKTDNGIVAVTTHLYDGRKSVPLDVSLYQHASSLPEGKEDEEFEKKPELAIKLIERSLARGYRPEIVLVDAGYGNNSSFLKALEEKKLKYIAGVAKNRKVIIKEREEEKKIRLDELAKSIPSEEFKPVELKVEKPKTVWVALVKARTLSQKESRIFAIVMNAKKISEATDIDYFITNAKSEKVTAEWLVLTYSQRNWVEVFYREVKGWLGWREAQVREKKSLLRHFILVFCAYTFIIYHKLTGGLRRQWANRPLNTFAEALSAFRAALSFRFYNWLAQNWDVFASHQEDLGWVWR